MSKKNSPKSKPGAEFGLSDAKHSARQIWQAGLAAFSRAQTEGTKAFEALVQEGMEIQRKTTGMAGKKMAETTSKLSSMASELSDKANGQWGKLETMVEERVAKTLNKLGLPLAKDLAAMEARLEALQQTVQTLATRPAQVTKAKTVAKAAVKTPARAPAKTAAKTPTKTAPQTAAKAPVKTAAKTSTKPATRAPSSVSAPTPAKAPRKAPARKAPAPKAGDNVVAAPKA